MAFNESIIAYFGGDTKGLQQAISQSQVLLKGFGNVAEKSLGSIAKGFGTAFAAGALVRGFIGAANAAQELRDKALESGHAVDEATAALARTGDVLDSIQGLGVKAFASITDWVQKGVIGLSSFVVGTETASEALDLMNKKAADPRAAAALEKLAATQREGAIASADGWLKVARLMEDQTRLQKELASLDANSLAGINKRIELEKATQAVIAATSAQKKKDTEEDAKLLKEGFDEDLKWYQKRTELEKKLREQKLEAMKPEERILALQKDITALKAEQKKYDKDSNEYLGLQVEVNDANKAIEQERLAIAQKLLKVEKDIAIEKSVDEAKKKGIAAGLSSSEMAQVEEYVRSGGKAGALPTRAGGQFATSDVFRDASTESLADIVRRERANRAANSPALGGFSNLSGDIANAQSTAREAAAQREIDFRSKFQRDLALGGVEQARRNFQGDPLQFDRTLQALTTKTDQSTNLLQSLDDRLAAAGFSRT